LKNKLSKQQEEREMQSTAQQKFAAGKPASKISLNFGLGYGSRPYLIASLSSVKVMKRLAVSRSVGQFILVSSPI
jgi:hypothetical protein